MNDWYDYINYLKKWADDHSDVKFVGCCPASFEEWLDCEDEEE